MTQIQLPSPAKLNLFLHITGRRKDGYHELQTLFQLIDLYDDCFFESLSSSEIIISCSDKDLENDTNLAYRAAKLLQKEASVQQGAKIHIDKGIPLGGGLGGGSSNAATTLLALNKLWSVNLPKEKLCELGRTLGADVPVFVYGKSTWAQGIGEIFLECDVPDAWYLILNPYCHVATANIFTHPKLTRNTPHLSPDNFNLNNTHNDCLSVVLQEYPEIQAAWDWLGQYAKPHLTGTGACIFAAFNDKEEALNIAENVPKDYWCSVVKGLKTNSNSF